MDDFVKKLEIATIERCARVADAFRERYFGHTMDMADAIAAAIRKLKEET